MIKSFVKQACGKTQTYIAEQNLRFYLQMPSQKNCDRMEVRVKNIKYYNPLDQIKKICEEKEWSIYKLAKESGIPYSSLNNMINRNTQPTLPTLINLCQGLNISLSDFFSNYEIDITPLNSDCKELINDFISLSPSRQKLVKAYIKGLCDQENIK